MPDPININETPPANSIAPNLDSELDAALSKSFPGIGNQPEQANKEKPVEVREEKNPEVPTPVKKEPVKNEDPKKPVEEKPLVTPEQAEKMDPKKQDGWNAIRNSNKRAHGIIQERESEIAKLKQIIAEKGSSTQKELEAIKAEKAELEKYRSMVDIQADPDFISNYDKPIESLVNDIKSFLKERNVTDESLAKLDLNDKTLLSQLIGVIEKQEGEISASEIRGKIREYLDLTRKRTQTLDEQKKNYKETLEKRKQESFAKQSEGEGRMIKHLELKASEKDAEGNPLIPFLNKVQPKENATQVEIDQANNHNSLVDALGSKLKSVLSMKEPEQQAEVAIAAVASHYLMAQLKVANSELKKAREELQKISVVNTEAPSRKPVSSNGRNGNGEPVDHEAALTNFFSRSR